MNEDNDRMINLYFFILDDANSSRNFLIVQKAVDKKKKEKSVADG